MFKSVGGIERLKGMLQTKLDGQATQPLSPSQLSTIENTELLKVGEKIDLVLISLGYKLTSEILDCIEYYYDEKEQVEQPTQQTIQALDAFFSQLPFPYFIDSLQKADRNTGKEKLTTWFQVCVNERVAHFMKQYAHTLTEIEDGVLYGYPLSAIRAFAQLIDVAVKTGKPSIERYFVGAGRPSIAFYEAEEEYYRHIWDKVKQVSPRLIEQTEKAYQASLHG